MNLNLESIEQRLRYIVGIGAVVALGLVMAWNYLSHSVAPAIAAEMPQPTIVMPAGYRVQLGSDVAQVFGQDDYDCGDGSTCKGLVLAPNEAEKEVVLVMAGRRQTERWTFKKAGSGVAAIRPNGEYVFAEKN
ncbi:hypothetical protein LPN04_31100 [Rugamonas sp. A1-17]|nr:hypothetical protein [Rugamonas sp. A1-17]